MRLAAHVVDALSDASEAFLLVIIATVPMPFAVLVTLASMPGAKPCATSIDAATGRFQRIEIWKCLGLEAPISASWTASTSWSASDMARRPRQPLRRVLQVTHVAPLNGDSTARMLCAEMAALSTRNDLRRAKVST